jgi:hypothetical protein
MRAILPIRNDGGIMRKSISIGTGAAVAAILTHGMVYSALDLSEGLPISTYKGFFQHVLCAIERMWSYVHGWQSMSHIQNFGWFYAGTVHILCPLIGFALFWMISRYNVGRNIWKPLAIALIMVTPLQLVMLKPLLALGVGESVAETIRTLLLVLAMVWSVGAFRMFRPQVPGAESLATA